MAIKNMKDLKHRKQQLEFQSKFYKKEMVSSASGLLNGFALNFRSLAFDFGFKLLSRYVFSRKKKQQVEVN